MSLTNASSCCVQSFSIDDDILNLIDEVDLDKVLKEAAEAFVDDKKFLEYVREKSTHAISRFLVRLRPHLFVSTLQRSLLFR